MNNKAALDAIIEHDKGSIAELVAILTKSSNALMKAQVLNLLAAVAMYSSEGYK